MKDQQWALQFLRWQKSAKKPQKGVQNLATDQTTVRQRQKRYKLKKALTFNKTTSVTTVLKSITTQVVRIKTSQRPKDHFTVLQNMFSS